MWIDIEQNTDEWLQLRVGKIGGSSISKIMANFGKSFGEPAKKMAVDIALERITGIRVSEGFSNAHMERGHEQEPIARMLYQDEFFCEVTNGGFYDNGDTGVSPDGHACEGLIEIKAVIPSVQYQTIKRNSFDPKYKWQLAFELRESKLPWVDYVSFCSSYPEGSRLFVARVYADDLYEEFMKIEDRLGQFNRLVSGIMADINNQG